MTIPRHTRIGTAAFFLLAACTPSAEHKRADSTALALSAEQQQLSTQLAAQKDSLTRVVLQADDFIMHIDSSMSAVKGLPKGSSADSQLDPLARQIENRKVVMARVDALVERARKTSAQLSASSKSNAALRAQLTSDSTLIAELNVTIARQTATINALSARVDSLSNATQQLGLALNDTKASLADTKTSLVNAENERNKAFYVIGTEDELVKRGVVVREGGANLLFAHPGRTLQIARSLAADAFTEVDQRQLQTITMPDTTRRYRVVSRQSLDNATVTERDQNSFRGNLRIADAAKFWAPSKYLVLVAQ
jgi:hypothetical protein